MIEKYRKKINADQILPFRTTGVTRCGSTLFPGTLPWLLGMVVRTKKLKKKKNEEEVVALQRAKRFNFNVLIGFFPTVSRKKSFPMGTRPWSELMVQSVCFHFSLRDLCSCYLGYLQRTAKHWQRERVREGEEKNILKTIFTHESNGSDPSLSKGKFVGAKCMITYG